MKRGDVIGFDYPFSDGSGSKKRPSLVVQSDAVKSPDVILAMISGTPGDTSVDLSPDPRTGIQKPCFVRCDKLYSVARTMIYGTMGKLPTATMKQVDDRLRQALSL